MGSTKTNLTQVREISCLDDKISGAPFVEAFIREFYPPELFLRVSYWVNSLRLPMGDRFPNVRQ